MRQRQRRIVAFGFACGSVVASFGLWTAIIGNSLLRESDGNSAPKVWDGALGTVGSFVEELAEVVVEQVHFAASTVSDISELKEVIGNPGRDLPISPEGSPLTDELSQWEIVRAYSLSIPAIDLQVPVLFPSMRYWGRHEWDLLEKQMQIGLNHGAVAYPHSVVPGEEGTFFVAGHSSPPGEFAAASDFGKIFERMPELKKGDKLNLSVRGQIREYEVQGSEVVPASATDILRQQSSESLMKIITCFPIGTTRDRMVITAKLVE